MHVAKHLDTITDCIGIYWIWYKTFWDRLLKDYSSLPRWFRGEGYLMYVAVKSA